MTLEALQEKLTPEQFRRFNRNRASILKITYWLLRPISFNKEKFLSRMASIDSFVIKSAEAIACSDRTGVVVSLSLSFGLGVSENLVSRIKSPTIRRLIPKNGGFYYVLSLGFGVFVHQTSASRRRLIFDVFSDLDTLDSVHTYAAEGSIALNWGVAVDRARVAGVAKMKSHYIGILGVVRQSVDHFSYSLITGIAFPPYLPIGMVYSNRTSRARIALPAVPLSLPASDPSSDRLSPFEIEDGHARGKPFRV